MWLSMGHGERVSGSVPSGIFGIGIISLTPGSPLSRAARRSTPIAMRPCGGRPCFKALRSVP